MEEQTQDEQQRQQQRGSGSAHGGTAWHQHALAASVALAHRVSQSGLISQMQGIHSLCEARRERKREKEGGDEEGGKKGERKREENE